MMTFETKITFSKDTLYLSAINDLIDMFGVYTEPTEFATGYTSNTLNHTFTMPLVWLYNNRVYFVNSEDKKYMLQPEDKGYSYTRNPYMHLTYGNFSILSPDIIDQFGTTPKRVYGLDRYANPFGKGSHILYRGSTKPNIGKILNREMKSDGIYYEIQDAITNEINILSDYKYKCTIISIVPEFKELLFLKKLSFTQDDTNPDIIMETDNAFYHPYVPLTFSSILTQEITKEIDQEILKLVTRY